MLNELKAEGKIRAMALLTSMLTISASICNMVNWNYSGEIQYPRPGIGKRTAAACRDNGIVVQVYSPLEQGLLTVPSLVITFRAALGQIKSGST